MNIERGEWTLNMNLEKKHLHLHTKNEELLAVWH